MLDMFNSVIINGNHFDLPSDEAFNSDFCGEFLREWCNDNDYVAGHSSGSTGAPKQMKLSKMSMIESARRTNFFFGLKKHDNILLCLSTDYIAGKMIVVRALAGGLNLIATKPSSKPNWNGKVKFAAMVPMQVHELLLTDEGRSLLKNIEILIIGGSPLDQETMADLFSLGGPRCFVTYGMTETLSHIAVAEIAKFGQLVYKALPDVRFSVDGRECLVANVPYIQSAPFVTNDVVELVDDKSFLWKGRFDNVVISGGVKLFPETIERKISHLFDRRFYMTWMHDPKLGQKLVLKIEDLPWTAANVDSLLSSVSKCVDRYEMPRDVLFSEKFEETSSGKVIRKPV